MSLEARIARLEQQIAYTPAAIGNYTTAPFLFYQTADDGNGYPQPQDMFTSGQIAVYFGVQSQPGPYLASGSPYVSSGGPLSGTMISSGAFSGTMVSGGLQPLTVNNSGMGWYFGVPSRTYIPQGQNLIVVRDNSWLLSDENGPTLYVTASGSSGVSSTNNIGGTGSTVALGFANQGPPWVIWGSSTN